MLQNKFVWVSVFAFSFLLFLFIAFAVDGKNEHIIDSYVLEALMQMPELNNSVVMTWISFLGAGELLMILTILAGLWIWIQQKSLRTTIFLFFVMGSGVLLNAGLKFYFQRGRPEDIRYLDFFGQSFELLSYSFPSGHAMRSFLFFGCLLYLIGTFVQYKIIKHTLITLLSLLILFIGISRIVLDAHYPTDIIGAYAVSLSWLICCASVFEFINRQRNMPAYK